MSFADLLERNRIFATRGGHQGVGVFPDLRVMVLTCLDPRVEPAGFLGLASGEAMVLRNAGGRVTEEVIRDVAFIGMMAEAMVPEGPLFEVAVIHHTQCGTGALAAPDLRGRYAERIGADVEDVAERAVLDPDATVAADVEKLRTATGISPRVRLSGHVYDIATGLIHTAVATAPAGAVAR